MAVGAFKARRPEGRTLDEIESEYRTKGRTLLAALVGDDPFDFWVGPFYVGLWGVVSVIGITFGTLFYLYYTVFQGPFPLYPANFFAGRLAPPPLDNGLALAAPGSEGFFWQLTIFFATLAFLGWMLRQVDISRKLGMGYQVPISYGAVFSSWLTLQVLRPLLMGSWGEGFTLGIMPHLDWVSNFGYRYGNFFYNPFHDIAISLFFASTLVLCLHGATILSAVLKPDAGIDDITHFWWDILGSGASEIGVHRLGFWLAIAAVECANLCILTSGPLVNDWIGFWSWWPNLPWWAGS